MMQQINLKPVLIVRSRTRILYDVIDELTRAFLVQNQESTSGILRRGILEKQYLSAIHIYLIDWQGKRIAEIDMQIDWDLHRLKIKNGLNEFNIDPSRSINEQISEVFPVIKRHIQSLKTAFRVSRSEVWYTYKSDIHNNPTKYAEAKRYVGTGEGTPPEWSSTTNSIDDVFIEFISEALEELRITIHHKRKP
jgi:hypothetical protein